MKEYFKYLNLIFYLMDNKEHKEYQIAFDRFAKKITASKEEAENFLIRSGIHDKQGKLSKVYEIK